MKCMRIILKQITFIVIGIIAQLSFNVYAPIKPYRKSYVERLIERNRKRFIFTQLQNDLNRLLKEYQIYLNDFNQNISDAEDLLNKIDTLTQLITNFINQAKAVQFPIQHAQIILSKVGILKNQIILRESQAYAKYLLDEYPNTMNEWYELLQKYDDFLKNIEIFEQGFIDQYSTIAPAIPLYSQIKDLKNNIEGKFGDTYDKLIRVFESYVDSKIVDIQMSREIISLLDRLKEKAQHDPLHNYYYEENDNVIGHIRCILNYQLRHLLEEAEELEE
jgi:hypothetical protein